MGIKEENVLALLEIQTEDFGERIALGMKGTYGWQEFTYKGVSLLAKKLAHHLVYDLKIPKGERLAILSESKPEYGACLFGSIISGLITVPLDVKLTKYELSSILSSCLPTVMLVSQHYLDMALNLQKEVPSIKHIIVIDENCHNDGIKNIYELPDNYNAKWRFRSSKSTALIIYTSGTTGAPKGVEITFKNIVSQLKDVKNAFQEVLPDRNVKTLSILPMNHLFELTVGFSTFLHMGFSVYYTQSLKPKDILSIMREKQIEFMIVVPAFLRLLKTTIEANLKKSSTISQYKFKFLYHLAKFLPSYRVKKFLFRDIHEQFGGKFIGCLSGGAPLDLPVARFFERVGIRVFQGYGLSETSPVVSFNVKRYRDFSSVGPVMPQFEARIDEKTGELQLKGPSVMKGYYNQPELTAQAFTEDGWLHTGDIAKIEKNRYLYITGRIKNMIVLSGGKKVFPEEVESVLEKSEYLAEVCVIGQSRTFGAKDNTEEVVAVVVPQSNLYEEYSEQEVEDLVRKDLKVLLQRLTPYKRPSNIIIRREGLPRTTTRKVKRREVKELVTC